MWGKICQKYMQRVHTLWIKSYFKRLQLHKYNIIIVQQILVVTFEFTGAARGFMSMSCAARGVKKVGQHWFKHYFHQFTQETYFTKYVIGSGKSGLKSPMIKQQKLAEMPLRWKILNFRFLAYIIKYDVVLHGKCIYITIFHLFHKKFN